MCVSVIVLAGGLGRRFQSGDYWVDKLLARVDGLPIIYRVLDTVAKIADEVIISTNSIERGNYYKNLVGIDAKIVLDEQNIGCMGPLLGIASSIKFVSCGKVLVVPGDMPFIKGSSLRNLIGILEDFDIVSPIWFDGFVENLVFVAKRDFVSEVSKILCRSGFWSVSGLVRGAGRVKFVDVSKIFSSEIELVNINFLRDLKELKPRKIFRKGFDLVLERDPLSDKTLSGDISEINNYFVKAIYFTKLAFQKNSREHVLKASEFFKKEAFEYERLGILGLAHIALRDCGEISRKFGLFEISEKCFSKSNKFFQRFDEGGWRR